VGDGAAADVGEGFEDDLSGIDEVFDALLDSGGGCVGGAGLGGEAVGEEVGHVVEDGLHPGGEFLVFVAGEVADVSAEGHDGAGAEEFLVDLLVEGFDHSGGECEEGFACSGGADEGDEADGVVEEEVEGHCLLEVAGEDSEDGGSASADGDNGVRVAFVACECGVGGVVFVLEEDEFVGVDAWEVEFELFIAEEGVDEVAGDGDFTPAGVEAFEIDFLCFEILGGDAEGVGFDAGVDVFGDEDDFFALTEEVEGAADDSVVWGVGGESGAEFLVFIEDDADAAMGLFDGDALGEVAGFAEAVEVSDDGSGVSAEVVVVGLEGVELLDDFEGDDDLVVGEHEQGIGVVEQDVGVEDKVFDVAVGVSHKARVKVRLPSRNRVHPFHRQNDRLPCLEDQRNGR